MCWGLSTPWPPKWARWFSFPRARVSAGLPAHGPLELPRPVDFAMPCPRHSLSLLHFPFPVRFERYRSGRSVQNASNGVSIPSEFSPFWRPGNLGSPGVKISGRWESKLWWVGSEEVPAGTSLAGGGKEAPGTSLSLRWGRGGG